MKTRLLIIIPVVLFGIISISESFAEEKEIMIFVENDARKVYYTGENIKSTFYDHKSASVIFETGMNSKLEIKAPQIYKKGPELFILKNGEEIAPETKTDDCFYYVEFETTVPEKIEIIFAFWPEYPETKEGCETFTVSPLKQHQFGISVNEVQCKESLVLITKYDGSPACVTPITKQYLLDREWAKIQNLDKIKQNPELIKQNIIRVEDGFIALYPENMCASIGLDLLTEQDMQRYHNDERGLDDSNTLQITSSDLKEIPDIEELIYAVHSIEFPYNRYSSAYLDGVDFVEYEFFLMEKAMKKYGDSKDDYFIKLDNDYEERFANIAKQGFTNHFETPVIVYSGDTYLIGGTFFWTSDEHKPMRMGVYPKEIAEEGEKFITLTDVDMKSIPKIKEAIENIGTVQESISAYKGMSEDKWNEYQDWFKQKSQDRLNVDGFRLIQYDEQYYSIGFLIC